MANNLDDITAIRLKFDEIWTNDVPVIFDNEPAAEEPSGVWARFTVRPGAQVRAALGSGSYLQLGRAILQVFVPEGQRDAPGWDAINLFASAFRDLSLKNHSIRFKTPEFETMPDDYGLMIVASIKYEAVH